MLGLTPLGAVHTAISLIAVAAGFIALVRDREISPRTASGRIYVVATILPVLQMATGLLFIVFLVGAALQVRRLRAAGAVALIVLAGGLGGCAVAPAEQEAIRRAWEERDAERARECRQARGGFIAGACVFGGGS
jgi:hypothetical protein